MKRDIKFRCWFPKGTDTGDGEIEKGEMCYALAFEEYEPINDLLKGVEHLMQFTGIKDAKGGDIYEGDILLFAPSNTRHVVEFRHGAFMVDGFKGGLTNDDYYYLGNCRVDIAEVIGNLYETPELLEGGK